MGNQTTTPFQLLKTLPTPLKDPQCVVHKYEILICGGFSQRACYSYHTLKNEYKFICQYPNNVKLLGGHYVVKLVDNDNNKDSNQITLLSFDGNGMTKKHTLVMKYRSVWDNDNDNKSKISNKYNQWLPFTDNNNRPIIIARDHNYSAARALIGGRNNNLLFITYSPKNISVFDLNTFQFIKHDTLPTNDRTYCHCFVSKSENRQVQEQEMMKTNQKNKQNYQMLLFKYNTGLSIEYDEDNNTFQFRKLPVCKDIALLYECAYVCTNDVILFFGGHDLKNHIYSRSVHKYSIGENKWTTFQNTLPRGLKECAAILSEDKTYVHIIGGCNGGDVVSTHMKKEVSQWLSKKEMKKGKKLKIEEEEEEEEEEEKEEEMKEVKYEEKKVKIDIDEKEEKKKWMKWWKERNENDKAEMIEKFEQLSSNDFGAWILNQSKWKNDLNDENISGVYVAIENYINYHSTDNNDEKKDNEINQVTFVSVFFFQLLSFENITAVFVQVNDKKVSIYLKELTLNELFRQCCYCLDKKDFTKLSKMKMDVADMNDNIIESDEDVMKVLELKDPTFKLIWTHSGEKIKIKNALVMMIAISEYNEGLEWKSLKNVKDKDIANFKKLFEEELKYDFVCNDTPNMTQEDVKDYIESTILSKRLRKNINKYDGLIIIICGHGNDENVLVTSEGKTVSIDKIHVTFDSHEMPSLKDCPKIFIIDACRGRSAPHAVEIRVKQ
ncbi:hypothetical protein RFI_32541 [Reticulomyxa filosa]|uniref:Caspase family p20 domain-containing protein n=1 Tax=Reticulomyxa filosa TaxID=46433 RepID=X6LVX6_RETFI|nr:hypothetical protein RFI_32541 [Reticulomyxa filosa]|eukprot:ETO04855.1 hypothetical protein RFI_32541 [Reticulomyxa filosa]